MLFFQNVWEHQALWLQLNDQYASQMAIILQYSVEEVRVDASILTVIKYAKMTNVKFLKTKETPLTVRMTQMKNCIKKTSNAVIH